MNTTEIITDVTRVISSNNSVGCDIDGEMVLLDIDSGVYFGLNAVGADIWNFIREERSVEEIQDHLLTIYDVSADRCRAELYSLLAQLASRGLIRCH